MGVLDKFMDIMKLNDDEYDDDFYDDEEFEDDYEEKPARKTSLFKRDRGYDDEEDDFDDIPASPRSSHNNKVTPMRQPAKKPSGMEVCVVKPTSVDDAREICETLLDSRTVILNLEGLDLEIAQRIIDFTSGATFAISGNLQKISNYIFLVTPTNVDISGDLQDLLNNSFDVSSIRPRY